MVPKVLFPKVLFYVQHLLGIGHVVRAGRIVRALLRAGFDVTIANGGHPVDGIDWGAATVAQLPPVSAATGGFSDLVTTDGVPVDDAFKAQRRTALLALLNQNLPDILLIEAYPFARRIMRFELKPLLQAACELNPRPIVVSSIRDILQEGRKPERITETTNLVQEWFDAVLVHGDPELAALDLSYPDADAIADKLHYTGFVGPEPAQASGEVFDVIVSAGGGAVGDALFETALASRAMSSAKIARWLFLTGPNLSADTFQKLKTDLPANVSLERFRPDVPSLLKSARLSISQAGYNTMVDVLTAGCRSIVVPFARGGETEQTRRAALLEARGLTIGLAEAGLTAPKLAGAIDSQLSSDVAPVTLELELELELEGAAQSAQILKSLLERA